MQVVDKKTKKPSVIFDVEKIVWLSEDEADVEGGYVCARQCMAGGTYHLTRNGTQWTVKRATDRACAVVTYNIYG